MFVCKVLEKVQSEAVERPTLRQQTLTFTFPDCTRLSPPVMPFDDVSFSYSGKPADYLYDHLSMGVDCDSRIALVTYICKYIGSMAICICIYRYTLYDYICLYCI